MRTPMPSRRSALLLGAGSAAAAAAATFAAPRLSRAQGAGAVAKIGVLQPLTGALSQDGEYGRLGAELGIADANAEGRVRLEPVFGDARSTPEGGVAEVERMAAEGCVAVVGGFASPICLAASQAAARHSMPYVVDVGVSDQIVSRGLRNTFRFGPGFSTVTRAAVDNLVRLNDAAGRPARTVVLVHEDGLFGSGLARLMATELPKHGFEVQETIPHPTPARDMSNVALRIRALDPDLLIPSSYYGEFVLLARTLQQRRVRPKATYAVLNGAASNPRFVREFPEAAAFVMDCNHWADPRKPRAADLRRRVEATGRFWLYNVPLNHSCVGLVADALARAGRPDRDALTEALASSTWDGHVMPYGPTRFENGQNTGAAPVNTQVQDGEIRVIFPAEFADARPVFPAPRPG